MAKLFTADQTWSGGEYETWSGGEYELGIELGARNDEVLLSALKSLWQHPALEGCYLRMDVEPEDQSRLDPSSADLPHLPALPLEACLRGVALLPNGSKAACRSDVVREENGADWLYFGLPMGALGTAYPVGGYPLDDGREHAWCEEVDRWLAGIGRHLFERVPFRLGLIGWDAGAGLISADEVARDGIPEQRWIGFLWPEEGRLNWYPPTRTGSPMTIE